MKEYMLLFVQPNEQALEQALHDEKNGGKGCFSWVEKLQGQYISGNALHTTGKRISGKDRIVSDRSSSEVKELIGGYFVVKASSMEEVVRNVQENFWGFGKGSAVEIRDVMEM